MKNMSLKRKITLAIVMVVVFVVATSTIVRYFYIGSIYEESYENQLLGELNRAVSVINSFYLNTLASLSSLGNLSQIDDILNGDIENANLFLTEFIEMKNNSFQGVQIYGYLAVLDASGNMLAYNRTPHFEPGPEHTAAALEGNLLMSDRIIDPETDLAMIWVTLPIVRNTQVAGIIAVSVNTQNIAFFLDVYIENPYVILVLDRYGNIIYAEHPSYVHRHLNDLGILEAFGEVPVGVGFFHVSALTGVEKFAVTGVMPILELHLVAFIDAVHVRDIVWEVLSVLVYEIGMTIIGASFVIFLFGKGLKPLDDLALLAKDVARGKTNLNIPIDKNDEIGQVFQAFAEIVKALNLLSDNFLEGEEQIRNGNIIYKIDQENLSGGFEDLVVATNRIIKGLLGYLSHVTEPVVVIDQNGKINFTNNVIYDMTKLPLGDIMGRNINDIFKTNITALPAITRCLAGTDPGRSELTVTFNDEVYELEVSAVAIYAADATIRGAMVILTDKTAVNRMRDLSQKRNEYRQHLTEKLTGSLGTAFEKGNLDILIEAEEYDDETESVAEDFRKVEETLLSSVSIIKSYVTELTEVLEKMSNKNFKEGIQSEYTGDFESLKISINTILENMKAVFAELRSASAQVRQGSAVIAENSQTMSLGFDQQLLHTAEVNKSIEEITNQINSSLEEVKKTTDISAATKENADFSNEQMTHLLKAMEDIKESSKKIANIIKVVEDIAFQTNLLSLNASVEAARAGQYGAGFAVVAEEVRNLALRSSQAVKESAELISTSVEKVNIGTKLAEDTAKNLTTMVEAVNEISSSMEKIFSYSQIQNNAIDSIGEGMRTITKMIEDDTVSIITTSSISQELAGQAETLEEMIGSFEIGDE